MQNSKRLYSLYIPWTGIIIYCVSLLAIAIIRKKPWGDEVHYIATIKLMAENLSWHAFVHYPEINGPLSFFCYALWGKIFGFGLFSLRILTIIMAITGIVVFYNLFKNQFTHWYWGFAVVASVYMTPYVYGMSIFVFPDPLTLCCIALTVSGFVKKKAVVFTLAAAAMLISKQYTIFVLCAIGGTTLINVFILDKKEDLKFIMLSILAFLPLSVLITIWRGIAPPEGIKIWDASIGVGFHPSYLNAYLSMIVVYALPANLIALSRIRLKLWMVPASILSLVWYAIFPIQPSRVTLLQTEFTTIGFFHRLLNRIIGHELIVHGVMAFLFCIGLYMFVNICLDLYKRIRQPDSSTFLLAYDMIIISFFCVMPFSFHVWEKYLMFVLPFWAVRQVLFETRVRS
ncbi:MAG: glycosyltransferase family 39 protein [Proteobacteria bacterium]|nr:glycosyltransferase family 39 protein [Pseudomonadota bacterium]